MFVEKRKLTEALRSIPDTTFIGSSEFAVTKGNKFRSITLDYGIWELNGNSEDGSVYETLPQFVVQTYVKASAHDESVQEAESERIHNELLFAVTTAFEGFQIQVYGVPLGIKDFGSSSAFVVSYNINIGPCDASFKQTS